MMKAPFFGQLKLYWCQNCDVPLISAYCSICKVKGAHIEVAPPGDIYPCFEGGRQLLNEVIRNDFGKQALDRLNQSLLDSFLIFNRTSYEDRMDQVIAHGQMIGNLRYNLEHERFEFIPSIDTAQVMWGEGCHKYIIVDSQAEDPIKKGASVLSPGVCELDSDIDAENPVLIVSSNRQHIIAVAIAKIPASEFNRKSKGIVAKKKYYDSNKPVTPAISKHKVGWDDIIKANSSELQEKESEAIEFIKRTKEYHGWNEKCLVAYSGGKDSLVTLELVNRAKINYDIMFINTGLEFPETITNCEQVMKHYSESNNSLQFWTRTVDDAFFWNFWDKNGPPSRDARWCCKRSKLSPVSEILKEYSTSKEVLSFVGKRQYESLGRSKERRIATNEWIPQQLSIFPILHWNALEVHLYIYWRQLTELLNPIYQKTALARIGCWVCPASNMADLILIKQSHPLLAQKLNERLEKYQMKNNLPEEWISKGLWRWRKLPPKILNLIPPYVAQEIHKCNMCNKLDYIVEQKQIDNSVTKLAILFSHPISTESLLPIISVAGHSNYDEEADIIIVSHKKNQATINADGNVEIHAYNRLFAKHIIAAIIRAEECDGCKTCIPQCAKGALTVTDGRITVNENCSHCGKCIGSCPLWRYKYAEKYSRIWHD